MLKYPLILFTTITTIALGAVAPKYFSNNGDPFAADSTFMKTGQQTYGTDTTRSAFFIAVDGGNVTGTHLKADKKMKVGAYDLKTPDAIAANNTTFLAMSSVMYSTIAVRATSESKPLSQDGITSERQDALDRD